MKRKLQILAQALIALSFGQVLFAQLPTKNLNTLLYDGKGKPSDTNFTTVTTISDSVTFTQKDEGLNFLTRNSLYTPVLWYSDGLKGFAPTNAYTIEANVAINVAKGNGFNIESQIAEGKRFRLAVDTNTIYNMTYYPDFAKDPIVMNLDNKGMHKYRVSVDTDSRVYVYRDGVFVAIATADGVKSSSSVYKDIEEVFTDQFFEDYANIPTTPSVPLKWNTATDLTIYPGEASFKAALTGNWDFTTISTWAHLGIDTVAKNVKVGKTSLWFNNGTTGMIAFKKPVTVGKYRLSFYSKTLNQYEAMKGYVQMEGTGGRVLLPSQVLIPDTRNYGYREYVFDVLEDGNAVITFHNGWSNTQKPGWCNGWIDDLRLTRVEPLPYVRFGKDAERGVSDFTLGSFTYDVTGAYAPDNSAAVGNHLADINFAVSPLANGKLRTTYMMASGSATRFEIVNLTGKVVASQQITSNAGSNSIELAAPAQKGIYFLRMMANGKNQTAKFIIK